MLLLKEEEVETLNVATDNLPPPYTDAWSPSLGSPSGSETRYLYYLLRSPYGAHIPSRTAFDPASPSLGRIPLRAIPPPRTAVVLKRCSVTAEGLLAYPALSHRESRLDAFALYSDEPVSQPLAEETRIGDGLDGNTGSLAKPYILLVPDTADAVQGVSPAAVSSENSEDKYFYYRLYTPTGEADSVMAFKLDDPSLGRVARDYFLPSRNRIGRRSLPAYSTIISVIAQLEARSSFASADVYASLSASDPLSLSAYVLDDVARTEETAIVLVSRGVAERGNAQRQQPLQNMARIQALRSSSPRNIGAPFHGPAPYIPGLPHHPVPGMHGPGFVPPPIPGGPGFVLPSPPGFGPFGMAPRHDMGQHQAAMMNWFANHQQQQQAQQQAQQAQQQAQQAQQQAQMAFQQQRNDFWGRHGHDGAEAVKPEEPSANDDMSWATSLSPSPSRSAETNSDSTFDSANGFGRPAPTQPSSQPSSSLPSPSPNSTVTPSTDASASTSTSFSDVLGRMAQAVANTTVDRVSNAWHENRIPAMRMNASSDGDNSAEWWAPASGWRRNANPSSGSQPQRWSEQPHGHEWHRLPEGLEALALD
ncbi:hypothetical protein C8F01DRAFT_1236590 [Mycena amicta]|nr:hypothetical protein C8F01DRAFT_1236590 [Mycena amicta]